VVVVSDWETAYYTNFSGSSGRGSQPMVVSYASSPAAELIYAETPLEESPTGSIVADGTCWRQIEFAGILKGTPKRALQKNSLIYVEQTLSREICLCRCSFSPVLPDAALPEHSCARRGYRQACRSGPLVIARSATVAGAWN
jgi:thiamine transport system substrate-binding protein